MHHSNPTGQSSHHSSVRPSPHRIIHTEREAMTLLPSWLRGGVEGGAPHLQQGMGPYDPIPDGSSSNGSRRRRWGAVVRVAAAAAAAVGCAVVVLGGQGRGPATTTLSASSSQGMFRLSPSVRLTQLPPRPAPVVSSFHSHHHAPTMTHSRQQQRRCRRHPPTPAVIPAAAAGFGPGAVAGRRVAAAHAPAPLG